MPCEHGALCHARPSGLRLPLQSRPRVPPRRHGARQRPPTGVPCASGNEMPGPSVLDEDVSIAPLHSRNISLRTIHLHQAERQRLPLCVPRWQSRCAALFQCAWPRVSTCIAAYTRHPAPSARESNPLPDAPSAATCVRVLKAHALQSIPLVSARQPWLMPSAPLVPRRLLLAPGPLPSPVPLSRRDL